MLVEEHHFFQDVLEDNLQALKRTGKARTAFQRHVASSREDGPSHPQPIRHTPLDKEVVFAGPRPQTPAVRAP